VWQHDWLKKLDEILSSLGEELDSIMVSAFSVLSYRMSPMMRS